MDKATVESVMAKAMMLVGALGDSCEAATSLPFLEAVTALRADVERLAAQAAPPANIKERWNIERDGADILICFNTHDKGEPCEYERFVPAQAATTEPPQEFESAQGRALASAWAEGWAQCRDAEYVGDEAESEAFNQSHTLAQCLHSDQTRFQGGLSNDQLRRAWSAKLPNVIPTDEQLTAFALGIEIAALTKGQQ